MPLAGHDDVVIDALNFVQHISIHVPLAGHDSEKGETPNTAKEISIHVPLAGHDLDELKALEDSELFQSTCPLRGTTGG